MTGLSFKMATGNAKCDTSRIIEALDESFHEPEDSASRETTKKHECTICGFATDRLFNFRRHIKVHSDDTTTRPNNVVCTHCGKQFSTLSGLTRHSNKIVKIHTQNTKDKCEFCQKLFNEKCHFQGHMSSHIEHKAYTCVSCRRSFQYRPNLLRHEKTCGQSKSVKKQHICETCGAEFSRQDILKDHRTCKHTKTTKTYDCSYCGVKYFWRSSLSKHINTKHQDVIQNE